MSNILGFSESARTLTGLNNINADDIECETLLNQPASYFDNIDSNIQSQLNTLSNALNANLPTLTIGTVSALPYGSTPTVESRWNNG